MFRQLANILEVARQLRNSCSRLARQRSPEYLEACWRLRDPNLFMGLPPSPVQPPGPQVPPAALEDFLLRDMARLAPLDIPPGLPPAPPPPAIGGAIYPHLSYALMLEQTR